VRRGWLIEEKFSSIVLDVFVSVSSVDVAPNHFIVFDEFGAQLFAFGITAIHSFVFNAVFVIQCSHVVLVSHFFCLACLLFTSIIYTICVYCAIGKTQKVCKKFLTMKSANKKNPELVYCSGFSERTLFGAFNMF